MNNDQQELGNLRPDFSAGLLYDSTSTNGVLWQLEGVSPRTEMFEEGSTGTPTFGEQKFHVQPIVCRVPLVSLRMVCMMCVPIFLNAMDDEAS